MTSKQKQEFYRCLCRCTTAWIQQQTSTHISIPSSSTYTHTFSDNNGLYNVHINPNAKETTQSVQYYTWTERVVSFAFGFIS